MVGHSEVPEKQGWHLLRGKNCQRWDTDCHQVPGPYRTSFDFISTYSLRMKMVFSWRLHPSPLASILECWEENSISSHLPWKLPQSKLHLHESPPNSNPSPGRVKKAHQMMTFPREGQDQSHSLFKLPPTDRTQGLRFSVVFWFSVPLSVFSPGATQERWHLLNLDFF